MSDTEPNPDVPAFSINKSALAHKAINITTEKILVSDSFTSDEAINLANLYASYWIEYGVYVSDSVEQNEEHRLSESVRHRRLKIESALFAAQEKGEYSAMKEYIYEESKNAELGAEAMEDYSNDAAGLEEVGRSRTLSQKLKSLADAMPNNGPKLPQVRPSWQDPEIVNAPDPEEI